MSELTLDFIQPDVVLEFPVQQQVVLSFPASTPGPPGTVTTEAITAALDLFDEYDSDESAAADGVAYKGWYVTADNHVQGPGFLKQNRIP